jgi:hypothetical protein
MKHILLAATLSAAMVLPALANESLSLTAPLPQFSAADTSLIFEADAKPMELAALSQQEMKETEGAVIWFYYGGAMLLANAPRITSFGMNMLNTSAYQPMGHAFNWINTQRTTYFPNTRWW